MNTFFKSCIVLAACLTVVACQSKEDKALALIDKQMFSSLYDYDSYQPVETILDSAFNVAEYNKELLAIALVVAENISKSQKELNEMQRAQRSVYIWSDSYSSYGRSEYNEAKKRMAEHLEKTLEYGRIAAAGVGQIREKAKELDGSFCGWKVTHKFRCKTKGGSPDLGTYVYIFDKDVKEILYNEDTEDDELLSAKKALKDAIDLTEEQYEEFISAMTTNIP